MVGVLEITSTPDFVAVKMIMKCRDLRCAVEQRCVGVILKDLDDQWQKLCSCPQENYSVQRIPRSKQKVQTSFDGLFLIGCQKD